MKIHCLIPSFFPLDQWQHLPSSPFLLRIFAAKWIAIWFFPLVNPLNGLIKPQDKSEGLVPLSEADGLYLWGISSPARAFVWQVKPRGFAVISEPFVSFAVVHPRSCRKRSQTCSAGTQEQSDGFCCLLCPDPRRFRQRWWALLFAFLIYEFLPPCFGACIPPGERLDLGTGTPVACSAPWNGEL